MLGSISLYVNHSLNTVNEGERLYGVPTLLELRGKIQFLLHD